jgi:hypothetical protein
VLERLKPYLGSPYTFTTGSEARFCCPYCYKRGRGEDTKYHLYVNKNSGLFFCQRCEAKGHVSFIDKSYKDPEYGRDEDGGRRSRIDALKAFFAPGKKLTPATLNALRSGLPEDYIALMDYPLSEAADYLEDRGIPFELAMQRGLGFGATKNRGRIIFPVFNPKNRSQCVFWVARSYTNQTHGKDCDCFLCKYKYTNAPDVQRRFFIYGLEFCDGDTVCLTEGPISALCAGPNAVAAFGKYVTPEQLELLSERFATIQVAQDPDAYRRSFKLMKQMLGMGINVQWVPLPRGKDPADVGWDEMIERRKRAITITRTTMTEVLLRGLGELE